MGQQKSFRDHTTLLASMCHAMPFSARALKKNIFFDVDIVVKKTNRNVVYRRVYSCRQQVRAFTRLPNIFSYCFCTLSKFEKVFERKVWRVQAAHLHNAARALSSPSRCFQLSRQIFILAIFDIVVKENRMWFSVVCTLIDKCCGLTRSNRVSPQQIKLHQKARAML